MKFMIKANTIWAFGRRWTKGQVVEGERWKALEPAVEVVPDEPIVAETKVEEVRGQMEVATVIDDAAFDTAEKTEQVDGSTPSDEPLTKATESLDSKPKKKSRKKSE